MHDQIVQSKVDRIANGGPLRVLDLFAGCGGISLGFHGAGFQIAAAVEIDAKAAATHALNFHGGDQTHAQARDITKIEPDDLCKELGLGPVNFAFDVVVGGPPCQAYARVGRAKLREVADHPEAFKVDPRGNLYLRYLHYVKQTAPLAVLVENVPDALNYGGHNVIAEMAEVLSELGYEARYTLINAAFHGVPQMRDRVFLMAVHRSLGTVPEFPSATRHFDLPSGYLGTRAVAMKHVLRDGESTFVPTDFGTKDLPPPVTAREAIGDLPPVLHHLSGELTRGKKRPNHPVPYKKNASLSDYGRLMTQWPSFERPAALTDHVIRLLPRDTEIFRQMPAGGEYPAAHATAVRLFELEVERIESKLGSKLPQTEREALFRKMVPPYPVGSFPNRWWKLRPESPVRTLMAHIGKDTYSHIHYDSDQARVISVREAARLQSFPDGFRFFGSMNAAYRQIGNAVPPVLAKRLAQSIRDAILGAAQDQTQAAE